MRSVPEGHFREVDAHLVEQYAQAIALARRASNEQYAQAIALARRASSELAAREPVIEGRASPWVVVLEKAHRSSVALAARLRLAPQSRADSRSAGRNKGPAPSAYEMMAADDAD